MGESGGEPLCEMWSVDDMKCSRCGHRIRVGKECPISDLNYGGLSGGIAVQPWTEYLVGWSRTSEAVHCLLGSLGHMENALHREESLQSDFAHAEEEYGLIEKFAEEYSRDLYVGRNLSHKDEEYIKGMVEEIEDSGPEILRNARQMRSQLGDNLPPVFARVAENAYDVLIHLTSAMMDSVDRSLSPPIAFNAFTDPDYRRAVDDLGDGMRRLETLIENP